MCSTMSSILIACFDVLVHVAHILTCHIEEGSLVRSPLRSSISLLQAICLDADPVNIGSICDNIPQGWLLARSPRW